MESSDKFHSHKGQAAEDYGFKKEEFIVSYRLQRKGIGTCLGSSIGCMDTHGFK
jgi:hypothetical protein